VFDPYVVIIERDDEAPRAVLFSDLAEGLLFAERYNRLAEPVWEHNFHNYARTPASHFNPLRALQLLDEEIVEAQGESVI
jgi:hypothetical protein